MNLSGVAVTTTSDCLPDVARALAQLPGVEVFRTDAASGRIVAVIEAESVAAEVDAFKRIQALPHVVSADLVYHYFGDAEPDSEPTPASLEAALAQLAPQLTPTTRVVEHE